MNGGILFERFSIKAENDVYDKKTADRRVGGRSKQKISVQEEINEKSKLRKE